MRGTLMLAGLSSVALLLTACAEPSETAHEKRCGIVKRDLGRESETFNRMRDELIAFQQTSDLVPTPATERYDVMYQHMTAQYPVSRLNDEFERQAADVRTQVELILRIVLNDRSCFSPAKVAKTQEAQENLRRFK